MANFGLPNVFLDFDTPDNYTNFETALLKETTLNFAIEFNNEKAFAARDLTLNNIKDVLAQTRPPGSCTRWINIFAPNKQPDIVGAIAKTYQFSPRLAGIMASKQDTPNAVATGQRSSKRSHEDPQHSTKRSSQVHQQASDPEKNDFSTKSLADATATLDLSHYKLINEVWHYCSVDWGHRYLCLGYNSLPNIERSKEDKNERSKKDERDQHWTKFKRRTVDEDIDLGSGNFPMGKRVWSWLLICDDGTIVTMLEDPFPSSQQEWSDADKATALVAIRRNILLVVRQLSNVRSDWRKHNPISTLDIRPNMASNQNSMIKISDSPGLLFYYLFDDWYTSYALVAKKEQQYAARLENLREHLLDSPSIELIKKLHQAGRQLAVLKRIYQSYALIISRILEKKNPAASILQSGSNKVSNEANAMDDTSQSESNLSAAGTHVPYGMDTHGAPLSPAVTVRFERLLDRINLYALPEIQECLDEKDGLVFLNFNLIALKESFAVEKLTRITILLAKATILFLPVSLMTGYFSTQIQDIQKDYTVKTYWASFAVIFGLSFLFLLVFGWISGTLEGKVYYQSIGRVALGAGKKVTPFYGKRNVQ